MMGECFDVFSGESGPEKAGNGEQRPDSNSVQFRQVCGREQERQLEERLMCKHVRRRARQLGSMGIRGSTTVLPSRGGTALQ